MLKALDGLTWLSRMLVGSLFVVSGLIKSNDAMGFMYKLEEYFEPGAMNLEFLTPWALELAVFVCIAEVLLGIAILMGALPRLTAVLTMVMMVFFTWLTWYTATCDPQGSKEIVDATGATIVIPNQCVLECGCFGNAIPLTAYQSFLKDVALLVFVIPIFISAFKGRIQLNTARQGNVMYASAMLVTLGFGLTMLDWTFPVLYLGMNLLAADLVRRLWHHKWKEWGMALGVLVVSGLFQYYTLAHLPLKDYRPYAIGESLLENMDSGKGLGKEPPVEDSEVRFYNPETGDEKIVMEKEWGAKWWNDKEFKQKYPEADWENKTPVIVKEGWEPRIQDLMMMDADGFDLTDSLLRLDVPLLIHVSKDLETMPLTWQEDFNALGYAANFRGWKMVALTNVEQELAGPFAEEHGVPYPFLTCDQTELKIIIRSNPGLVLLQHGVVLGKWAGRDVPTPAEMSEFILKGEY